MSAAAARSNCGVILNQARAIFNDSTADVTTVSPLASINIKCK